MKAVVKFSQAVIAAAIFVTAWNAYSLAKHFYDRAPVVSQFTIEESLIDVDHIVFSGFFKKERDCQFKEVIAYKSYQGELRKLTSLEFQDSDRIVSRAEGLQSFGPWKILITDHDTLELHSRHDCDGTQVVTDLIKLELKNE